MNWVDRKEILKVKASRMSLTQGEQRSHKKKGPDF